MTTATATPGQVQADWGSGPWKGRGNLALLVKELQRQLDSKFDFVADSRTLQIVAGDGGLKMLPIDGNDGLQVQEFIGRDGLTILPQAITQIGQRVDPNIPAGFLRELCEKRPVRAAALLTHLLQDTGKRNMIRCLDGNVRAFLSQSFRIIDHWEVARTALEECKAKGGEVIEATLTDQKMKIKFTTRAIFDVIQQRRQSGEGNWFAGGLGNQKWLSKVGARTEGDLPGGPGTIHPLTTISNSETGHGGFGASMGFLAAICFNLATVETVVAQIHLGERLEVGVLSQEAIAAENTAIMLKARDTIRATFDETKFRDLVERAVKAQETEIKAPAAALDNLVTLNLMPKGKVDELLAHFIKDYDPTAWGLAQAVARLAQDTDEPEEADDLEALAGKLIMQPNLVLASA